MQVASSKQQTKQKYKPNYQKTGISPHSALPIRGKTNKQTKTQHRSHPIGSLQTTGPTLGGQTKSKKEFNLLQGKNSTFLEAWEKETSNTVTLKKNNEKAEKYCTNERRN